MKQFSLLLLLHLVIFSTHSQGGLEVHGGMGLPETLNAGIRYLSYDFAGGMAVGFLPGYDESLYTISGDIGFTYGKKAINADSKRSQLRLGLIYYREETDKRIFKDYYLKLAAGRNYFFTEKLGVGFDLGLVIKVADEVVEKEVIPVFFDIDLSPTVLPAVNVRFFYRPLGQRPS